MAQGNRTEVKAQIANDITATVTIAKLTGNMSDDFAESAVFRKDVVNTGTGSGAQALDYEDYDQIEFTATGNTTFSFSNLNDGDVVKLIVIKGAAHVIAFSGVTDIVESRTTPDTRLTYRVTKVNTRIYVERIDRQFSGTLGIGDYGSTATGQVTAVSGTEWAINGNTMHVEGVISTGLLSAGTELAVNINLPKAPKTVPTSTEPITVNTTVVTSGATITGIKWTRLYYSGIQAILSMSLDTSYIVGATLKMAFQFQYIID